MITTGVSGADNPGTGIKHRQMIEDIHSVDSIIRFSGWGIRMLAFCYYSGRFPC